MRCALTFVAVVASLVLLAPEADAVEPDAIVGIWTGKMSWSPGSEKTDVPVVLTFTADGRATFRAQVPHKPRGTMRWERKGPKVVLTGPAPQAPLAMVDIRQSPTSLDARLVEEAGKGQRAWSVTLSLTRKEPTRRPQ